MRQAIISTNSGFIVSPIYASPGLDQLAMRYDNMLGAFKQMYTNLR